jgi:hypothetical protein
MSQNNAASTTLQANLVAQGTTLSADSTVEIGQTEKVPPSPLDSFLSNPVPFTADGPAGVVFRSVFLIVCASLTFEVFSSGYKESFSEQNKFYHSHFDTSSNVQSASVAAAATILARTLYVQAGGTQADAKKIPVVDGGEGSLVATMLKVCSFNLVAANSDSAKFSAFQAIGTAR